jgi:VWFA-related protein
MWESYGGNGETWENPTPSSNTSPTSKPMPRNRFLALLCFGAGAFPGLAADDAVFRSDVALVRVDAQVLDRSNRAITGLRAEDFVLRDEGQVQPIRNFASENMPVDVLLLLDVSGSMRPHLQRISEAAGQALRVLREGDRVGIMVFDRYTRIRLPLRPQRQDVERELHRLLREESFNGGTDITRGLLDAAAYIGREGRRDARRAIVIVTDDETERERDEDRVSNALLRADAVLSALLAPDAMRYRSGRQYPPGGGTWPGNGGGLGGPLGGIILGRRGPYGGRGGGPSMGSRTHSAGTAEIAHRSGGDSVPVDDAYALQTTLERIRQRYALYFYLPAGVRQGQQRSISVELSAAALRRNPYAEVRYRREYYVSSAPAGTSGTTEAPAVITQTPTHDAPAQRRGRAVSQPDASHDGPLSADPSERAGDAPPAPAAGTSTGNDGGSKPASKPGRWRRVSPGEQE